jgi:hypothetical protein
VRIDVVCTSLDQAAVERSTWVYIVVREFAGYRVNGVIVVGPPNGRSRGNDNVGFIELEILDVHVQDGSAWTVDAIVNIDTGSSPIAPVPDGRALVAGVTETIRCIAGIEWTTGNGTGDVHSAAEVARVACT